MSPSSVDLYPSLAPRTRIVGKWTGRDYTVQKKLGAGANGAVYAATGAGKTVAIKVSYQSSEIALEYQALKECERCGSATFAGPLVLEMDDAVLSGRNCFYYVMEYVAGETIDRFISQKGLVWLGPLLLQLANAIDAIHRTGHTFGDLKAENILVRTHDVRVRLVDFGGVTPFGRGVRQFTQWSDRAWWGRGERRADEAYDLFAFAQLAAQLCLPNLHQKMLASGKTGPNLWTELVRAVENDSRVRPWKRVIVGIWRGEITTAGVLRASVRRVAEKEAIQGVRNKGRKHQARDRVAATQTGSPTAAASTGVASTTAAARAGTAQTRARRWDWTTWFLVASATAMSLVTFLAWRIWA